MNDLSNKAKIIYATLEKLGAKNLKDSVTSYAIMDFIEEDEDLQNHELLKNIDEQEFMDIILDLNLKSINTLIASMCRKDLINKTEPMTVKIDGISRKLRKYFIK